MTIEDMEDKVDFMPGAYLHELWQYHERVKKDLASSLLEFRKSGAPNIVKDLHCGTSPSTTPIPQWLCDYIESLARSLHSFDLIEFENALTNHVKSQPQGSTSCPCVGISSQTMRAFWEALTTVISETIDKADSTLSLVKEGQTSESSDTPSIPLCSDLPDANIILRSSDQVNFRVRKSVLAMSSPFFEDLLSLPQPPDGELVDGLPVVELPEDSGLLNSLISLLYPIAPVIPNSYEKVFTLLGACQEYDMASIQSYIRSEVHRGTFSAPVGADTFRAYAIASSMGLIPEMERMACLTLGYPMTFEFLGEALRSFEGWALCDLARYRKSCRDNLVSCLDSFFDVRSMFQLWAGCREPTPNSSPENVWDAPTVWLRDFFSGKSAELQNGFTHAIGSPSTFLVEYPAALKNHNSSHYASCCDVYVMEGRLFRTELEGQLKQALDQVNASCHFRSLS
ncbi:hypothetical protein EI94DRAFT_1806739 [Lactarius quietus]|nr:hypothetical protein EI94DRAFT_1806739 [Lactarius quietus]